MAIDHLSPELIQRDLNTRRIGRRVLVLEETTSTNDVASAAARQHDADGLVVLADHQTGGRGRLGRQWSSPRGASVLCSVLLVDPARAAAPYPEAGVLMLAAGIATCEAIASAVADVDPVIRWPNDIFIRGKKVAGILIESRLQQDIRASVIGIGINCLQQKGHFVPDLRRTATSLDAESHTAISRLAVVRSLLFELDRWLADPADAHVLRRAWLDRAEPLGQHIHLRQAGHDFVGTTIDVDPTAGLVVQLDGGGRRVFDPATTTLFRSGGEMAPRGS